MLKEILSDPVSGTSLRRSSAMLVMISLVALLASRDQIGIFARLCAFNAFVNLGLAAFFREPAFGAKLNRWDEVLAFAALFLGARAVAALSTVP
jgi:hypothetical protein